MIMPKRATLKNADFIFNRQGGRGKIVEERNQGTGRIQLIAVFGISNDRIFFLAHNSGEYLNQAMEKD